MEISVVSDLRSKIAQWGRQALVDDFVNFHYFREEAKQKKCLKNLIDSDCKISSANREVLDMASLTIILSAQTIGTLGRPEMISAMVWKTSVDPPALRHPLPFMQRLAFRQLLVLRQRLAYMQPAGIKTTAVIKATAGFNTAASIKIAVLHTLLLVLMFIFSFPNY